ncbi:MAG: helix-turn-helix domain-containing protein [Oscillospiraceae bacterium]|nr:helix-turn-helix domain-containing protein [Oscillospiraceae bacterium]
MKISNTSAQQIVEEIGKLVRQNINLMDETGHIIASNDPSRIGKFHPGAYEIITHHMNELYITQEMEKSDVRLRQGINLPIQVDGQVEGVIGITGIYDEVIQYGQIVKKMAEILVRERIAMDEQRLDQRIRTRFLEEWIMGEGPANLQNLSDRGYALGIDISKPRRCVVVSPRQLSGYTDSLEGQEALERVEQVVSSLLPPGCMVLRNTGRQILVLPSRSNQTLAKLCRRLTDAVSSQLDVQLVCGIDGGATDIHTAYLQAGRAWRFAQHAARSIVEFDSLHAELLLDHISRDRKIDYLHRVFPGCTQTQIREFISLLEAWFAADGSLNVAAQALYIHKNTIQYRLKRISEISGLDVRRPSQAPALYLAVQFFQELDADRSGLST